MTGQVGTQSAPTLISAANTATVGATTLAVGGLVAGDLCTVLMFSTMTGAPGITISGTGIGTTAMTYDGAFTDGNNTVHLYSYVLTAAQIGSSATSTFSMTNGGTGWAGANRRMWIGTWRHMIAGATARTWSTDREFSATQDTQATAPSTASPHDLSETALGERPGIGFAVGYASTGWGGSLLIGFDGNTPVTPGLTVGTTGAVLSVTGFATPHAAAETARFSGWSGAGVNHIHGFYVYATKAPLRNSGRGRTVSKWAATPHVIRPRGGALKTANRGAAILNVGITSAQGRARTAVKMTGQVQMVFPGSGRGNTAGVAIAFNEVPSFFRGSARGRSVSRFFAHPVKVERARSRTVSRATARGTLLRQASGRARTATSGRTSLRMQAPGADASRMTATGHVSVHTAHGFTRGVLLTSSGAHTSKIRSARARTWNKAVGLGRMVTRRTPARARTATGAWGRGFIVLVRTASGRANTINRVNARPTLLRIASGRARTVTRARGRGRKPTGNESTPALTHYTETRSSSDHRTSTRKVTQ